MPQLQITLDDQSLAALDGTAMATTYSREDALKEAISNYISYDRYVREKVAKGLQDIANGEVLSCEEVDKRAEARIARLLTKHGRQAR